MARRETGYDVVYVSQPREAVYRAPRRSTTSRDYEPRYYASDRYPETPRRSRTELIRDPVVISEPYDEYGSDVYYVPSRASRDAYRPEQPYNASDRPGARFATAPENQQRRRRSSDNYTRRRPASPDEDHNDRRDRGRRDDRRSSPTRRLRSAMRGSRNESSDAQRRARARSVSFRETEASRHDVGNQKHERPGYEARAMGQYLRHDDDDDLASETYAIRRRARRYS